MLIKGAVDSHELYARREGWAKLRQNGLKMFKPRFVRLNEDAHQFCIDAIRMVARGLEDDNGRAVLSFAVAARPCKAVNVDHPSIPSGHDRKPGVEIATQDFMFLS